MGIWVRNEMTGILIRRSNEKMTQFLELTAVDDMEGLEERLNDVSRSCQGSGRYLMDPEAIETEGEEVKKEAI